MNPQEHHTHESTLYGYKLLEIEGKHAAWTTYKATEEASGKQVSALVFDTAVSQNPQMVEALEDYAFQASRLNHVNLQQVITLKNGQDGCMLVKEYVEGTRLDMYLQQKQGINWQHVLRFLKHMLHGLGAAHEAGFMQCVPTPQNVVIARGNTAKLTDMGVQLIIRKHSLLSDDSSVSDNANPYLAPESAKEDLIIPNAASDIYAVGLLGYEMLTGHSPRGQSESNYFVEENLTKALAQPIKQHNKGVPEQFSEIIQKATEHHAIHRFNNAEAMLEALEELTPAAAKPNVVYHKRVQHKRRRFRLSPATVLILTGLAALLGAGYYYKPMLQKQNPFEALNPAAVPQQERPVRTAGPLNEAAAAVPATTRPLTEDAATSATESTPDSANAGNSPAGGTTQDIEENTPAEVLEQTAQAMAAPAEATPLTKEQATVSINTAERVITPEEVAPAEEPQVVEDKAPESAPPAASTQLPFQATTVAALIQEETAEETPVTEPVTSGPSRQALADATATRRTLILTSEPGGAMVSIEGKAMGTTPFQLSNITSEQVDIVLSLPGHKSIREQIDLANDRITELFFDLLPENRPLILNVFPWGNVYLDGELVAERVSGTDTLFIAPENYTLSIEHPSFGVWEQALERGAAAPLSFDVDFTARAAFRIAAYDDNRQTLAGEVFINGHNTRQTTPVTIELPLGKHTIEVRAEGYEPIQITRLIERNSAEPEPIKLQLQRK
ncbi:MAG: PEGA domain-containing protein [Bacteroidota bacterium]